MIVFYLLFVGPALVLMAGLLLMAAYLLFDIRRVDEFIRKIIL